MQVSSSRTRLCDFLGKPFGDSPPLDETSSILCVQYRYACGTLPYADACIHDAARLAIKADFRAAQLETNTKVANAGFAIGTDIGDPLGPFGT